MASATDFRTCSGVSIPRQRQSGAYGERAGCRRDHGDRGSNDQIGDANPEIMNYPAVAQNGGSVRVTTSGHAASGSSAAVATWNMA